MKISLAIMALSLLLTSVSHAEEGYLDTLNVNKITGEVFKYDEDGGVIYNNSIENISLRFPISNSEIHSKIEVVYKGAEPTKDLIGSDNLQRIEQYVTCDTLNKENKKTAPIKDANGNVSGAKMFSGKHKFNFVVNNQVIGKYAGSIINNSGIWGTYEFINGETHTILSCVNDLNKLVNIHTVSKLSPKGEVVVKQSSKMDYSVFDFEKDGRSITIGDSIHTLNLPIENRSGASVKGPDGLRILLKDKELNRAVLSSNISGIKLSRTIEIPKCDGSNYKITEDPKVVNKVSEKPIKIEYFADATKVGEFYGYVTIITQGWGSGPEEKITPQLGTFTLINKEIQEYSTCLNRNEIESRLKVVSLSDLGKVKAEAIAREMKQKEADEVKQKAELDKCKNKDWGGRCIDDQLEKYEKEQKREKAILDKLASFRKNLKVGQQVRFIHPYRMRGKVVQVINEYKVKVKITQEDKRDINVWADVKPYTLDISKNDAWYYEKKQTD